MIAIPSNADRRPLRRGRDRRPQSRLRIPFGAAALSAGTSYRPAAVATFLYYVIVVLWGSRNAALGVVGEIRERTWDVQRLSALSAGQMTWGKLFGATIYIYGRLSRCKRFDPHPGELGCQHLSGVTRDAGAPK